MSSASIGATTTSVSVVRASLTGSRVASSPPGGKTADMNPMLLRPGRIASQLSVEATRFRPSDLAR